MQGEILRFYVAEERTHHGVQLWEWLLETASKLGIHGGSAFRAIGSFGRRHVMYEARFFEQSGSSGIEVEFISNDYETTQLLEIIRNENIRLFYARVPVDFGVVNPDENDSPELKAR